LVGGCKDSGSEPPKAVDATPVNPATAGSISVNVRFAGTVPEGQPVNMASTPACAQLHPEPVYDRSLVVSGGNLANAVVYIEKGLESWVLAPPAQPVVLDQKGCLYEPRVAAAMVGQGVEFENSDTEAHNVHGRPKVVEAWNFMMSRQGQTRTVYFTKPEMGIPVGCDIHPWMRAFLCVLPNPYFAVTGRDGQAVLKNVPPGEYTIGVWHETLGTQEQPVTLTAKGEVAIGFTYQK
jgi:plastocyanin